ncbi:MAG: hypothetical protein Q8L23_15870 [Caulobacter sp.]|nr:hypothetical protein [Caulobacter sp.]
MSWRDTLSEAQSRLTALEAAELKVLIGDQVAEVSYDGGATKWAKGATLSEIRAAIAETRMMIQRLSGATRTGGVIAPIFGD